MNNVWAYEHDMVWYRVGLQGCFRRSIPDDSSFKPLQALAVDHWLNGYWVTERTVWINLTCWFITKKYLFRMIYYTKCLEERFVFVWIIFSKAYSQCCYYPNQRGLWINTQGNILSIIVHILKDYEHFQIASRKKKGVSESWLYRNEKDKNVMKHYLHSDESDVAEQQTILLHIQL